MSKERELHFGNESFKKAFEVKNSDGTTLEFEERDFSDILGDCERELVQALFDLRYEYPTKIQNLALQILGNKEGGASSVIAESPSGTGKTIAFLLCCLKHLSLSLIHI